MKCVFIIRISWQVGEKVQQLRAPAAPSDGHCPVPRTHTWVAHTCL